MSVFLLRLFSDLRGTAVKYLDLSYHPAQIIHSDRTRVSFTNLFLIEKMRILIKISYTHFQDDWLECSCFNDWIQPPLKKCERKSSKKANHDCSSPIAAVENYDFDFDVLTVNTARVSYFYKSEFYFIKYCPHS